MQSTVINIKSDLLSACEDGGADKVRRLLAAGVKINEHDKNGNTPLMLACTRGRTEIVELLLTYHNFYRNLLWTKPLYRFLGWKNLYALNAKNNKGETALMLACTGGRTEIVELLLTYHNSYRNLLWAEPLYRFLGWDNPYTLNAKNNNGDTALMLACRSGTLELVKLLVLNHETLYQQSNAISEFLLERVSSAHKVDIDMKTNYGYTALMIVSENGYTDMVKFLIEMGVDINVIDNNLKSGPSPMVLACKEGRLEVVECLLDNFNVKFSTFSADAKDRKEYVPLIEACKIRACCNSKRKSENTFYHDKMQIVDLLLKNKKVDVNEKNDIGVCALIIACREGNLELVKRLLKHRANVNVIDSANLTLIMSAIDGIIRNDNDEGLEEDISNRRTIVELLLEKGVNPQAKTSSNDTALYFARQQGDNETMALLLKNGGGIIDSNCYKGDLKDYIFGRRDSFSMSNPFTSYRGIYSGDYPKASVADNNLVEKVVCVDNGADGVMFHGSQVKVSLIGSLVIGLFSIDNDSVPEHLKEAWQGLDEDRKKEVTEDVIEQVRTIKNNVKEGKVEVLDFALLKNIQNQCGGIQNVGEFTTILEQKIGQLFSDNDKMSSLQQVEPLRGGKKAITMGQ